jgi:hypothetical protein
MKARIWKGILIGAIGLFAYCGAARAQVLDNVGCSNSTLKGDYAFTVSGQIFLPSGVIVQREGIAMTHFNGEGGLTQIDLVMSNPSAQPPAPGVPPLPPLDELGFQINEFGTYAVRADCTGTFTIDFPELTNPETKATTPGAKITTNFVLSDGGRAIHTIVTKLVPPGATAPVPALIRSEGHKLGPVPAQ